MAERESLLLRLWKYVKYLKDIPTERRNLGSDSLATPEPRERVLSSWTSLLNQELQCQGTCTTIESYIKDQANPGRMCRK